MAIPKTADDWRSIETREDFIALLELLAASWDAAEVQRLALQKQGLWDGETGDWAQGTPGAWLEAMHAWLTESAADGHGEELEPALAQPSWKTFGFILSASRFYE